MTECDRRKKVLLVGWNRSDNYGTVLQSLALYRVVSKSHDCTMLWERRRLSLSAIVRHVKLQKVIRRHHSDDYPNAEKSVRLSEILCSVQKTSLNRAMDRRRILEEYEVFLVGSDQVWNPFFLEKTNLLDFVPADKTHTKISYASSVGLTKIPIEYHRIYRKYWPQFDYISVREPSSVAAVEALSGKRVDAVLDPTLLLDDGEWLSFAEMCGTHERDEIACIPANYLLCLLLDANDCVLRKVEQIASLRRLPIVYIPTNGILAIADAICADVGLGGYLRLIKGAQYICTDSFHAEAFAIQFHKQFTLFERFPEDGLGANVRTEDMLHLVGATLSADGEVTIDYDKADTVLRQLRQSSTRLLLTAIGGHTSDAKTETV